MMYLHTNIRAPRNPVLILSIFFSVKNSAIVILSLTGLRPYIITMYDSFVMDFLETVFSSNTRYKS